MNVRPYKKEDFAQVKSWANRFGTQYRESQFPETGFIVDGVAAYFLYKTNSSVCFLENLISNRMASKNDRDHAIELVIKEALKTATELGFEIAYATTDVPQVVMRAMIHGAQATPKQTLLTKQLAHLK